MVMIGGWWLMCLIFPRVSSTLEISYHSMVHIDEELAKDCEDVKLLQRNHWPKRRKPSKDHNKETWATPLSKGRHGKCNVVPPPHKLFISTKLYRYIKHKPTYNGYVFSNIWVASESKSHPSFTCFSVHISDGEIRYRLRSLARLSRSKVDL